MNINDVWPKRWRLRHMMCKHRSSSDHCICLPPLLTIFTEMFLRGKPTFCSHYDDAVTDILCWYIDIFIFPNILKIIIIKDYFSRQPSFVVLQSSHVWRPLSSLPACSGRSHDVVTRPWHIYTKMNTCQILVFVITVSVFWQWKLQVADDYSVQNWKYGM